MQQRPEWLKKSYFPSNEMKSIEALMSDLNLNTVCREASCPNYSECFNNGTATIMILGSNCTRNCAFCGVTHSVPEPVDNDEPLRVAEAVSRLDLDYVVITSVTRDDLKDGGAMHFALVTKKIRELSPKTKIEVLVPDFNGDCDAINTVIEAGPDVISHNMETVKNLYDSVRPQADYEQSLELISRVSNSKNGVHSKSGIMVGLGEEESQIFELFDDLRNVSCEFLTIGQYLSPTPQNIEVVDFVTPETFDKWGNVAREKGFTFVASGPFVRSSYHAGEALSQKGQNDIHR